MPERLDRTTEPLPLDAADTAATAAAPEAGSADLAADERELLEAFERRRPQGSLQWGFGDAMRRIEHPDVDLASGGGPWPGLPADLWERGRSARIGQRFVGDVAGVMADILAADARAVAQGAAASVNVAVWDALRYLAARVEVLESRTDPLGLEAAEWPVPAPDPGEWADLIAGWLQRSATGAPVIVGESGDGALFGPLRDAGHRVLGVEPRGPSAWRSMGSAGATDGAGDVVLAEVGSHLRTITDDGAAGVVLVGCVDRLDLVGQLDLVDQAVRVVEPGGTVVVLAADQSAWSDRLRPLVRDLIPGRPLHPETWMFLLQRAGTSEAAWHRPTSGTVHAVVARVGS